MAGAGGQLSELRQDVLGQDEVPPADLGLDPPGETLQAGGVLGSRSGLEMRHVDAAALRGGLETGCLGGPPDLVRGQAELGGDPCRVESVRRRAVQGAQPDPRPLVHGGHRGLQEEGHLPGPGGIPAAHPEEHHRAGELGERPKGDRAPLLDRVDWSGNQAPAGQARLPGGRRGDLAGVIAGL